MDTPYAPTGHNQSGMDYPSTTQALFALIVMIIVLLFILVYCCWGTMACSRQQEPITQPNEDTYQNGNNRNSQDSESNPRAVVIFPFNSMIYVGEGDRRQIFHIPPDDEKPPAYTEIYAPTAAQTGPPVYNTESTDTTGSIPELPPSYEDYISSLRSISKGRKDSIENNVQSSKMTLPDGTSNALEASCTNPTSNESSKPAKPTVPLSISLVLKGSMGRNKSIDHTHDESEENGQSQEAGNENATSLKSGSNSSPSSISTENAVAMEMEVKSEFSEGTYNEDILNTDMQMGASSNASRENPNMENIRKEEADMKLLDPGSFNEQLSHEQNINVGSQDHTDSIVINIDSSQAST